MSLPSIILVFMLDVPTSPLRVHVWVYFEAPRICLRTLFSTLCRVSLSLCVGLIILALYNIDGRQIVFQYGFCDNTHIECLTKLPFIPYVFSYAMFMFVTRCLYV